MIRLTLPPSPRAPRRAAVRRPRPGVDLAMAFCVVAALLALAAGGAPLAPTTERERLAQAVSVEPEPGEDGAPTRATGFPDARERAARDWDAMTESVSTFWADAQRTADPLLRHVDWTLVLVAIAAALGGYLGAGRGGRSRSDGRRQPSAIAPPPAPPSLSDPAHTDLLLEGPGGRREPRLPGSANGAAGPPIRRSAPARIEPHDASLRSPAYALDGPRVSVDGDLIDEPALRPTHGPLSEDVRDRLDEADRLFAYFRERFGIEDETADSAITYLTRLGSVVESQRGELDEARKQLERLRRGGAGAAEDAAWDLVAEAGRAIRGAGQALRGDGDFMDFVRESRLEDALRRLAALRAARIERGERVRPDLAEQEWPHDLFRAEALAAAYYPTYREWRDLRFGLTLASACLRHLLRREGVFVGYVRLLSPMAQGEGEVWSENARGLRELTPVRRAVQATAATGSDGFVVDCETFGYFDAERDLPVRSRLIVYDQAEWR